MRLSAVPLLLASLCGASHLGAQANSPDGPLPPAITFGPTASSYALSGVDQINYFNGSLSIGIPLVDFTGRSDAPQNFILPVQNTWSVDQTTGAPVPSVIYPEKQYAPAGNLNVQYSYVGGGSCAPVLTWVTWSASSGQANLADESYNGQPGTGGTSGCQPYDRGRVFHSYDGSGLTYVSGTDIQDFYSFLGVGTLFFPNGSRYVFNDDAFNPVTILDRNGNKTQIQWGIGAWECMNDSQRGTYTVTDSAGRTVTVDYTYAPECGGPDVITYPGSTQSGSPARTTHVNYAQLHTLLSSGLPLGQQAQSTHCLFPQLSGSNQGTSDPFLISSVTLPDGTAYSFLYDYYGEVTQMTLPTGAVIQYKWAYPSSCSDSTNLSGAHVWSGGLATIYRRVLERDEYANGISAGLTGKIVYSATPLGSANNGPDTNHPTRSGGFGTQVDADFQDGSGNQLRHETHYFYGDPVQPESIPSTATSYPDWSDGLEYQTQVSQGGVTKQSQQKLWQQQPCSGCWFNQSPATPDTALRMNSPFVCQVNTTLDSLSTSSIVTFHEPPANNVTGLYEYDFGSSPAFGAACPGTAPSGSLRSTQYAYWSDNYPAYGPPTASSLSNVNLIGLPSYKIINGGSIEYFYYDQATPASASGAPGHDDTDFGASYNTRGNLTTHSVFRSETSSYLPETFTWDTTGRQ